MTYKSIDDVINEAKEKLDVICAKERELVKGMLWDLYAEHGMPAHQMRLPFNEVIAMGNDQ
ncbi:MAG: hypothetical protein WA667_25770 [Candidatus Nitrosopolaris sp.]